MIKRLTKLEEVEMHINLVKKSIELMAEVDDDSERLAAILDFQYLKGYGVTKTLLPPINPQKPTQLQNGYVDFLKIQVSSHKPNVQKEIQLINDPIIKLKRALLSATSDQLQKVNEQTKKSTKQQIDDEWER